MKRNLLVPAVLLSLVFLSGCGGGDERARVVSVRGTLYVDDQPHGPASLTLSPLLTGAEDQRPVVGGQVGADGRFSLTTYHTGDGAPPGRYQVSLGGAAGPSDNPADIASMMGGGPPVEPATVEIPAEGTDNLEIRLKRAGAARPPSPGDPL